MTEYRRGYWLRPGRAMYHGSITGRVERLSLFSNLQTSFVSHPVSPPVGTCGVLQGVKTARVWGGGEYDQLHPHPHLWLAQGELYIDSSNTKTDGR